MTPKHRTRLVAFSIGALAILMAIFGGSSLTSIPKSLRKSGSFSLGPNSGTEGTPGGGEFRRRNPFSIVRAHPPPAPPPAAPAPPIRALPPPKPKPQVPLPVRLVGTMAGNPTGIAFMIHIQNQRELIVRLGDNLGDVLDSKWKGVILTEVKRGEVTFSRGASTWELSLEEKNPPKAGAPARALGVRFPPPPMRSPTTVPAASTKVVKRAEVDRNLKNLGFLITQLNVQPFFQNGKPGGFRVSRIQPGSFVDKMGARNGDIIQSVNGKPIRTIKDAFLLYNSFKTDKRVDVSILRSGKPQKMGFELR